MIQYRHVSRDAHGDRVDGHVDAESHQEAARVLASAGLFPVDIRVWRGRGWHALGIGSGELATLLDDLSDLLSAGVPVARAIDVLGRSRGLRGSRALLRRVSERIQHGMSLADAMASEAGEVPSTLPPLLAAAEVGGGLATALHDYAALLRSQERALKRLLRAVSYPLVVSVAALGTLVLVLTYLVPRLTMLYQDLGQALPWPTRLLIGLSAAVRVHGWWVATLGAALVASTVVRYRRSAMVRLRIHEWLLRAPGVGGLLRAREMTSFCRSMATLLVGGVPMHTAIDYVASASWNESFRLGLRTLFRAIVEGQPIGRAVAASPVLAGTLESLLAVGEESGEMARAFTKAADFYERRLETRVERVATILEPLLILALGLFVALLVLAMILPILEVNFAI